MLVACLVFYAMDLDYILCVSLCSPSATVHKHVCFLCNPGPSHKKQDMPPTYHKSNKKKKDITIVEISVLLEFRTV